MSLYHKYRPKSLDDVMGNESTIALLKTDLAKEDKPHVFLISGPVGCGKTTLARIIATELGCRDRDFKEIDSADFRGIDTIRELRSASQFKPVFGTCRLYLLDECHKLTNDAQNALLKGLEDAPAHVYYILATTNPEKLIDTIKSRCAQYTVGQLDEKQMFRLLRHVIKAEGVDLAREVLDQIILDSDGHPRDALQILDQVITAPPEQQMQIAKRQAEMQSQTIQLCRAIINNQGWKKVANILHGLREEDPESVRRAVLGYCCSIMLKGESGMSLTCAKIMEQMVDNLYNTGYPGLVYECYSAVHATRK